MSVNQTPPFQFVEGSTPLLISIPHVGTDLPAEVEAGLSEAARPLNSLLAVTKPLRRDEPSLGRTLSKVDRDSTRSVRRSVGRR